MTLVGKKIKGIDYLYFQDSEEVDGKTKIITTFIGKANMPAPQLIERKNYAITKHMINIAKAASSIKTPAYHFESVSWDLDIDLCDFLELFTFYYGLIVKNFQDDLQGFRTDFFAKYVHGTTAIEGNTLSEDEASKILITGLTPSNKTVDESLEISNYNYLKDYLDSQSGSITERMIKQIHKLLMNGLMIRSKNDAGEYRTNQVLLNHVDYKPPPAEAVSSRIKYLLDDYANKTENNVHPVEAASYFHQKFEEIHPFHDGNGRVGRAILNYMLRINGYPEIYLTVRHRSEYLEALQEGNRGNHVVLFALIIERMIATPIHVFTHTKMYDVMLSEDMQHECQKLGVSEIYDELQKKLRYHKESGELP